MNGLNIFSIYRVHIDTDISQHIVLSPMTSQKFLKVLVEQEKIPSDNEYRMNWKRE